MRTQSVPACKCSRCPRPIHCLPNGLTRTVVFVIIGINSTCYTACNRYGEIQILSCHIKVPALTGFHFNPHKTHDIPFRVQSHFVILNSCAVTDDLSIVKPICSLTVMAFESTIQNSEHNCEMAPSCISVSGRSAMALQIKVGNCDVTVQHSVHCARAHWLNNCLESCRSYISLALVIISAERCKRKARVIIRHNGTTQCRAVPRSAGHKWREF